MTDLVPIPGVMLERLAALGLDVDRILERAGLPSSVLSTRSRVSTAAFFELWNAIEAAAPGRDLGLRLGSEALPHKYDIASMAALHSPTLGDAFEKLAKFKALVCPESVTIRVAKGEARIRFHWTLSAGAAPSPSRRAGGPAPSDGTSPRLLVDATFASVVALAQRGTGRELRPLRIELARRKADAMMLQRHFGCPIVFGAPLDLVVFPKSALAERFVTHNADLLALLLPGLEAELETQARERSLADDVRIALCRRMCGERPSVEKVAEELHVSTRTLQRRLGESGTSYQRLLDDVRAQSAKSLLETTDLEAGEVAFLLGFEELNSFTRAFHNWQGTTPARYRASRLATM